MPPEPASSRPLAPPGPVPQGVTGYRALYAVYDRWQASYGMDYSRRIFPKLLRTLRSCDTAPGSAVDLGCGTGTLALLLERHGWQVTGIDASPGMVEEARRKASLQGAKADFTAADIRTFSLPRTVDLAVSVYDVLNHLPAAADLHLACMSIGRALRTGGLFVFDLNNDRCFRRLWTRNETITERDFTMTLENSYDAQAGRAVSRVRVAFNDGREALDETVEECCFQPEEVDAALKAAGFAVLHVRDFPFPGAPWAGRLKTWYVARKTALLRPS